MTSCPPVPVPHTCAEMATRCAAVACHWRPAAAATGLLPSALTDRSDVRNMRDWNGRLGAIEGVGFGWCFGGESIAEQKSSNQQSSAKFQRASGGQLADPGSQQSLARLASGHWPPGQG